MGDTPAIAAAKNEHFAAKGLNPYNYAAPYAYAPGYLGYNGYPYAGAYAGALVAHPNGAVVPADTPAIAAAKNEHFAAKGEVYAAQGLAPYAYAGAYGYGYPYASALVAHPNGAVVPVDTPSVAAAKSEHFAAKGLAPINYAAPYAYAPAVYAPAYAGLVAHPNGALVPVEPADVVEARNEHLAAYASA